MKRKRFSVEQNRGHFEAGRGGVPVVELCRQAGITEQTFYRWKKQYVGLEIDQVRQLKQLQGENVRLKKLVAELSLDKTMLQDVLAKNSKALASPPRGELSERRIPVEPASCLPGGASGHLDVSVPEHAGAQDGLVVADSGFRLLDLCALWPTSGMQYSKLPFRFQSWSESAVRFPLAQRVKKLRQLPQQRAAPKRQVHQDNRLDNQLFTQWGRRPSPLNAMGRTFEVDQVGSSCFPGQNHLATCAGNRPPPPRSRRARRHSAQSGLAAGNLHGH